MRVGSAGDVREKSQVQGSGQVLECPIQVVWDLTGWFMCGEDELQLLLLFQQGGDLRLQGRFLIFQIIGLLEKNKQVRLSLRTPARLRTQALDSDIRVRQDGRILTAWRVSVSSRRRLRHLAAAILFLSRLTRLFSSSSGESCEINTRIRQRRKDPGHKHNHRYPPPLIK